MFWDNLPLDLRVYILSIRYNIRNKSSEIISKSWRKYIMADNLAIDLALELQVDQEGYLMVSIPETSEILNICLKIMKNKIGLWFWETILEKLKNGLFIEEYTGGPSAIYYNRTEQAYQDLLKKVEKNKKI